MDDRRKRCAPKGSRKPHANASRISDTGRRLTEARLAADLTQEELADRLKRTSAWVCRIERSNRKVNNQVLRDWATACGLRPEILLAEQLELPLITALIIPAEQSQLSDPAVRSRVDRFLEGASDSERQELIRYLAYLELTRKSAHLVRNSPDSIGAATNC